MAILGAIGRAARQGAIIKGGVYLEQLAKIDTVLLDKTGTVTYGLPVVSEINTAAGITKQSLLKIAATAEARSEHPVAKAVLKRAADYGALGAEPEQFEYRPGRGVLAAVNGTQIVVGNRALFQELGLAVPKLLSRSMARKSWWLRMVRTWGLSRYRTNFVQKRQMRSSN